MPELPATVPAPKPKARHNEWDRAKMVLFLRELAASQSVAHAARAAGMSRQSAYRLKNRLVGTPFALGWEVALEAGLSQLAHAVMDRAVNGVEVPHYFQGEQVGTSRAYDERLSIWLLSNPWKIGRAQVAREFSNEGFDRLMERIETGPIDWAVGDEPPGIAPPAGSAELAAARETHFVEERSWYGALARQEAKPEPVGGGRTGGKGRG